MIHPLQQFQLLKPQTQHDCDYLMQILSLFCMTIREKLNSRQMHIAHQEVNFTLTIHNNSVGVLCSTALSYRFWRNVIIYTTIYNIIYKGYHHMGRSQHALPQGFQHLHLRLWEHERARQPWGDSCWLPSQLPLALALALHWAVLLAGSHRNLNAVGNIFHRLRDRSCLGEAEAQSRAPRSCNF